MFFSKNSIKNLQDFSSRSGLLSLLTSYHPLQQQQQLFAHTDVRVVELRSLGYGCVSKKGRATGSGWYNKMAGAQVLKTHITSIWREDLFSSDLLH